MQEINLDSWEAFPEEIERIRKEYQFTEKKELRNVILFRGQADSSWKLRTSLERFSEKSWSVSEYTRITLQCAPQIESFTDKGWDLPREITDSEIMEKHDFLRPHVPTSIYKFWIYLRHHDFPSPLLDWTLSPYIASFFAFAENLGSTQVSIFVYIEHHRGVKSGWVEEPLISTWGPYVATHKRHFLQQSYYTIASKITDNKQRFVCHHDIFNRGSKSQDILLKINLPKTERLAALTYLNDVNINFFSLFQSEESLVRSLAFKELEIKQRYF